MKALRIFSLIFFIPIFANCQKTDTIRFDMNDDSTQVPHLNKTVFLLEKKKSNVIIKREMFKNDFSLQSGENAKEGEIAFIKCFFTNARIMGPELGTSLDNCHVKDLQITPADGDRDDYNGYVFVDSMENEGNLLISYINIFKPIRISGTIRGSITISEVACKTPDAFIDLSGMRPAVKGEKIELNLIDAPFQNIRMNYAYFHVAVPLNSDDPSTYATYLNLLDNFKKRGQTEDYEALDIEYQHYRYTHHGNSWDRFWGSIADFIDHYWWNYGYSRGKVLMWSVIFLFVFTIINIWRYGVLHNEVYAVKEINVTAPKSFYNSLIYTSTVFFSISLDLEKLKFASRGYLIWFMTIFIIGVICLGYTVNFVLKAGGG